MTRLILTLALTVFAAAGCAGTAGVEKGGAAVDEAAISPEARWGIRIKRLTQSGRGHMLDLRYEVTDPEKAAPALTRDVKPYILHKRTGVKLLVPNMAKVGPMQQTSNPPVTGVVYFMLFGNDGLAVPGDEVSLVIGDAVFDGLRVQ